MNKDYFVILAHKVRTAREEAGLLQSELAERTGLNQQHVSQIELGKQNVTLKTLIVLGQLLA